jgi:hypothetical protein
VMEFLYGVLFHGSSICVFAKMSCLHKATYEDHVSTTPLGV